MDENIFVPILYQDHAFEAFDDFDDFLESISCETSKSCQVPVVRIHAGEPLLKFNKLQDSCRIFVPILYRYLGPRRPKSLTVLLQRGEHGFEIWIQEAG